MSARLYSDLVQSFRRYKVWDLLAKQDIRQRYRRSALGPFWITLSMVISIVAIGLVYGNLFGVELKGYLPYLTVGFILWSFISTVVVESCGVITGAESIIKQIRLPFGVFILRMVWRNLLILAHHSVVLVIVLVIFDAWVDVNILLLVLAMGINIIAGIFLSYILGAVCCRYRDVAQIINSVMQVVFYVTPVIWKADILKNNKWILDFNPFYYFLEIIRYSLIGGDQFSWLPWMGSIGWTVGLYILATVTFKRCENKLALWL